MILNLVKNAVEAMQSVSDRPRELRVSSQPQGALVTCSSASRTTERVWRQARWIGFSPRSLRRSRKGSVWACLICRSIVEAHGGRITASHRQPYGSSFQFSLPVVAKGDESVPPEAATPIVVVIDDDGAVRESVGSLLESMGLETESYASVRDFHSRGLVTAARMHGAGRAAAGAEWARLL